MGVWVKAQAVRFSRNGCYETPWHVTGVSKLSGPEGTPKGMYVQIGLSEQGMLWSSIFVTLMANKIGGLQFGIYRNCQISSRVFHTAVAALPLTKANRSDFE